MNAQEVVDSIVDTYDLSPGMRRDLTAVATSRIDELMLTSFADRYRYIAELVWRFKGYREGFFESLDSPAKEGRRGALNRAGKLGRTLHDRVGAEDPLLERFVEGPVHEADIEEILEALQLNDSDLAHLPSLLAEKVAGGFAMDVSPQELEKRRSIVEDRLSQFQSAYMEGGRLVLPKRPIISVSFSPLKIKYGPRKYNGNPLAFFMKNREQYGGMTRTQLYAFDGGLYEALRTHRQLGDAIPDAHILSEKEVSHMLKALRKNRGNVAKTSLQLGHCARTIKKHAKARGAYHASSPLDGKDVSAVLAAYRTYGGNAAEAARHLPYSRETFRRYWKREELRK